MRFSKSNKRQPKRKIKTLYKNPCCWVRENGVWKSYASSELSHDIVYEKLHKNPCKYVEPDVRSGRLKIVEREGKKRHFALISETVAFDSKRYINAADQGIHNARIDYLLKKLPVAQSIKTITDFLYRRDSNSWTVLDFIDGMEWCREPRVTPYNIYPDILGYFPTDTTEQKFKANKCSLKYVLIESISKGPPDERKINKLFDISRNEPALIIFDIITHSDPDQSNLYTMIYDRYLTLRCSYYLWRGMIYKNGGPMPELKNYKKLKGEIRLCQRKSGFVEGIE